MNMTSLEDPARYTSPPTGWSDYAEELTPYDSGYEARVFCNPRRFPSHYLEEEAEEFLKGWDAADSETE